MGVRPGDWSPLTLSGDPTPGDPDVLRSVASYMDIMADHARTADDGLAAVLRQSGDGAFVGKTADWLREQISKEMSGFIAGVRTAFSAAGPAIRTYAEALREAQATADQALRDAAGAGDDEGRINTLKATAENAAADVKSAAGTARQAILDATGHIKSPVTPKSACEVFWEIFTWLTLIVTVVAIFVGGPLGLIAFAMNAALAVKATLDFAMGKTNALGLALGLLGLLGPSTRPLIALGDLTKLATSAWRNITQFSRHSFTMARAGIGDFWRTVSTLSLSGAMRGIGDIGVTLANSVKVGALMIPRIVGPIDGLAARGFVALEKFTLVTVPAAVTRMGNIGQQGLVRFAGVTADAGRFIAANAVRFGNLMAREFGGWQWLRIFLPLAGHEIRAVGVSGAFKLGVLGRGLGMTRFDGLAALGGGIRLANGLTTVHVVKPGGAPPPAGGINFSPSGLHLPDLIEKPMIGAPAAQQLSFSARGLDLSAARGALGLHDLAGLRGVQNLDVPVPGTAGTVTPIPAANLPGAAHAVDLGPVSRLDAPTVNPVAGMNGVTMPAVATPSAVTLPNMQIGNLSATLNRAAGGVEGLTDFGRAELRNLHMGEVSAVRVSETGVAFNLGAPEKAFGDVSLAPPTPASAPTPTPTPMSTSTPTSALTPNPVQLGRTADLATVHRALNLLDEPGAAALTTPHRLEPPTVTVPTGLGRDLSTPAPPRLDQAGGPSPQQLSHLQALEQLKKAQHALANVSGDALALARAEKDVRVTEALVRRTADGLKVEAPAVPRTVDTPPAHLTGAVAPDLAAAKPASAPDRAAANPAGTADESVQALQARLENLRGPDAPRTDLAGLELEHRFAQLRPAASADLAELPAVPTHQPGTSIAELESRLAALRGTELPSPAARQLELEHRLSQLRPGAAAETRPVDPAMFPDVPTISPVEATARATAVERLTDLEDQLVAARAETPTNIGPTSLDDAGSAASPQVDSAGRPQTLDQMGTPGRAEGPDGTGTGDNLLDLPSVPRTDPAATPGAEALSQRLTELISDARGVDLPEPELRVLSTEVRTAIEQGRHGDGARALNTLHDRIDRQALFQRLDSYRAHVDAGHQRAAQLDMDKSTWLQHAIDIERATAAGHTDELHRLLNDYENSLAGKLAEQKLHDQVGPDATPGRTPDEAGSRGDVDELQARLDALRGDRTPDARSTELELELRFANLRGSDGPDVPLPQFPQPPTLPPGSVDDLQKRLDALRGDSTPDLDLAGLELRHRLAALRGTDPDTPVGKLEDLPDVPTLPPGALDDLTDRIADLRAHREEMLGMPPAERAEWDAEFARAGDEAADAAVLARYETRIANLEREARVAELRGGSGPLSADEYRSWQDTLARVGDDQAGIDHVLSRYAARLDEHRLDSATQINTALTSPDHLRPLDSRLDEALGGLSQSLRNDTAARHTTLGDRLAQLRGADAPPAPGGTTGDLPMPGPRADDATIGHQLGQLPSPPRDLPAPPTGPAGAAPGRTDPSVPAPTRTDPPGADVPAVGKPAEPSTAAKPVDGPAATKPAETPTVHKPQDGPARPTPAAGDEVLQLPAPRRPADDVSAAPPAEQVTMPPRDLLGDGQLAGPARVIEVDAERWTPLKDAFRFEPSATSGQPPKVTRPAASGERVGVGYQLTVTDQDMHFALKLHLDAAPGVTAAEIAKVKARTIEGLQRYVNAPRHHLPGWDVPMRVTVDFVDDPAKARGSITVAPAGTQMSQQTWAVDASPAKYAHEIVHNLGVKDSKAPPNALLRDTHQPEHGDLMGSHPHGVDGFVLTPRALGQIAGVLSPHFSGSTAPRPAPDALTGNAAEEFWASGVDLPPQVTEQATVPAPAKTVSSPAGSAPAPLSTVLVDRIAEPPPATMGWVVTADGSYQWQGAGSPDPALPPGLVLGTASGDHNLCLLDSLAQLINVHNPHQTNAHQLHDHLLDNLPASSNASDDLLNGRMLDVYDPDLNQLLIDNFGIRVQVFETTQHGTTAHPLRGDEGPVFYLHHQHQHFVPLWPATGETTATVGTTTGKTTTAVEARPQQQPLQVPPAGKQLKSEHPPPAVAEAKARHDQLAAEVRSFAEALQRLESHVHDLSAKLEEARQVQQKRGKVLSAADAAAAASAAQRQEQREAAEREARSAADRRRGEREAARREAEQRNAQRQVLDAEAARRQAARAEAARQRLAEDAVLESVRAEVADRTAQRAAARAEAARAEAARAEAARAEAARAEEQSAAVGSGPASGTRVDARTDATPPVSPRQAEQDQARQAAEQQRDDDRLQQAQQRWAEFDRAARQAELERGQADVDAEAVRRELDQADQLAKVAEAGRQQAERQEAARARELEETHRREEEQDRIQAVERQAERDQLATAVRTHEAALGQGTEQAVQARTAWESKEQELHDARTALQEAEDAARKAAEEAAKKAKEAEEAAKVRPTATPWYFTDGALGELAIAEVRSRTADEIADTLNALAAALPSGQRTRITDAEMAVLKPGKGPQEPGEQNKARSTDLPDLGNARQEQGIREKVAATIRELLEAAPKDLAGIDKNRARWENALFHGITISAGDRLIWIRPVPHNPQEAPNADGGKEREYVVSFGSTATGRETSQSSGLDHDGAAELTFSLPTQKAPRMLTKLPSLAFGSDIARKTSEQTTVISGRKMFVSESTKFNSGVEFQIYVNGVKWGQSPVVGEADLLGVSLPTAYARTPPDGDTTTADAKPPAGTAAMHPVSQARETLNAISLDQVITDWHKALSAALPADVAAKVAALAHERLLNERTTRNRSRYLLTNGDQTDTIREGAGPRSFNGYITTAVSIREIQFLETTEGITTREDLGVVSTANYQASRSTDVSISAGGSLLRLSEGGSNPDDDDSGGQTTGGLQFGAGLSAEHSAALGVGETASNHTVLNRKSDQARYQATVDFTLATHGNKNIPPITRQVTAEIAMPAAEAAQFERSIFGDVFTPRFGGPGTGRPRVVLTPATEVETSVKTQTKTAAESGTKAEVSPIRGSAAPAPASAEQLAATLRPVINGAPQARQAFVPKDGTGPEPLALALRRGQGLGITGNLPGSEQVANLVIDVLKARTGLDDIGAKARRDVMIRVSRAVLEADPSRVQAGRKFSVASNGRTFEVLATAHQFDLLDRTRYPMTVNARALTGAATSGAQSGDTTGTGELGSGPSVRVGDLDGQHRGGISLPRVGVSTKVGWSNEQSLSRNIQEYARTETVDDIVDHRYRTVYEVAIREVTDPDRPSPRETWLIGDDPNLEVTTQTAVPIEHLPPEGTTHSEQELRNHGRAEASDDPRGAWEPGGKASHLPLDTIGSAGLFPAFRHIPELSATAAKLYQQVNGLPDTWFSEPMNWPDQVLDLSAPSELASQSPDILDEYGWEIQLPARDGYDQFIRVRGRLFKDSLDHQKSHQDGVELEHYRQFASSHSDARSRDITTMGKFGFGGHYQNYNVDAEEPFEQGRIGGGIDAEGEMSTGRSTNSTKGATDITRATYNDTVHSYNGRMVFEITAIRSKNGAQNTSAGPHYVNAHHALDLLITDRAAEDLELVGGTAVNAPALELIDPKLLPAVGHPEQLQANDVLRSILRALEGQGLIPAGENATSPLRRAVISSFRSRALTAQYFPLSGQGVYGWFPIPGPYTTTRYLWIRVAATTDHIPSSDRPRDQVSLTLRGQTSDNEQNSSSSGWGWSAAFDFHGRGVVSKANRGELGGLGHGSYGKSYSSEHSNQSATKDIFRTSPKKSHEFEHPLNFMIELATTTQLPKIAELFVATGRATLFSITTAATSSMWPDLNHSVQKFWYDHTPFAWESNDLIAGGRVRLIVPKSFTQPRNTDNSGWRGPKPAPPTAKPATPAPRPTPRWAEDTILKPAGANTELLEDRALHPWRMEAAAREFARWAALTTARPSLRPGTDLTVDGAWKVPGVDSRSALHHLITHYTSESMLRTRINQLLKHEYVIPDTNITLGIDIRAGEYYGSDTDPLSDFQKGRRYQQNESSTSSSQDNSKIGNFGFGPQGGARTGLVKKVGFIGEVLSRDSQSGQGSSAEMSEVNERNREAKRNFHQYRYDATLVIKGPHGALLIDVDEDIYLMRAKKPDPTVPVVPPPKPEPKAEPKPLTEPAGETSSTPKTASGTMMPGSWPEDEGPLLPLHNPPQPPAPPLPPAAATDTTTPPPAQTTANPTTHTPSNAQTTQPTPTPTPTTRPPSPIEPTPTPADITTATPRDDLRERWVQFQAQRIQAEGTDPAVAGILANGLTADHQTMLADLATVRDDTPAAGNEVSPPTALEQPATAAAEPAGKVSSSTATEPTAKDGDLHVQNLMPFSDPVVPIALPGESQLAHGPDPTRQSAGDGVAVSRQGQRGSDPEPTARLRGGGSGGAISTLMSLAPGTWAPWARSEMFAPSDAVHFYEEARRIGWISAGDDRVAQALHRLGRQTGLRSAEDKAREFVWHLVTTGSRVLPDIVIDGTHLYQAQVHGQTIQVRARVEEDSAGRVVRVVRAQQPMPLDSHVADLVQADWTVVAGDRGTSVDPDAQLVRLDPTDGEVHSTLHDIHRIANDSLGTTHLAFTNRALGAAALVDRVPTLVEQDHVRLVHDDFGTVLDAWRRFDRQMSWLLHTPGPRGFERTEQMPAGHHARASFDYSRWRLRLRYDMDADRSRDALVHEKFHSVQWATNARWRVAETGDPRVLTELIKDPEVHRQLLHGPARQLDAAQRHVAELLSRHGLAHPDREAIYKLLGQDKDLITRCNQWVAAARVSGAGGRLGERVQRAVGQVGTFSDTVRALYLSLLHEAQAILLGLWIQEAGSVHRWGAAAAQLAPMHGYDSVPLTAPDRYPHMPAGAAGVFLRPSSSSMEPPIRLPRREGMLLAVQITDVDQAGHLLRRLRDDLPVGTMVELLTAAPISAPRAVELARTLGGERVLALDVDLVEPTGAAAHHFVAYSRDHRASLGPGARYYTVHADPQQPVLDLDVVALRNVGWGRYELASGWQVQAVGQRVWIGPAEVSPAVRDDDPPVVIGLPSRQTPWPVWVLGVWVGRALASHVGATTESGFVRVHRPQPRPEALPVATDDLLHPVSDVERRIVVAAFGSEAVVDEVSYAPPDPAGPGLGFTGHDLIARLLDVAGAAAAEQNSSVLVAALDGQATRLAAAAPVTAGAGGERVARHNLLAAGYLAARAYGVFELTPQRLEAAHRVLAAYHYDGRFLTGEAGLQRLLQTVSSDWYGDVDPTRLQRLVELNLDHGLDRDDLEDLVARDDMWLSIWPRDLRPIDRAAGIWSMGGAAGGLVPPAAGGELVVVYRAGADLLPLPPAGSPAHVLVPTSPALLAELGTLLAGRIGGSRVPGAWVRLVPVVDTPVDPDLAGHLAEGLSALHRHRVDQITLGRPIEPIPGDAEA
ncbi:hypothetical protein [Solwaraspora sp. WMMA2065]|uniref:hypothetical protein n=1 Tax=Solwaraspora sp. WMMA2065 TaxID=3015166 RepID=UPI00259B608E|nr:hypothetical protein [Solwaraspora sp. WMMA2065]WJK33713.1 hypothetical protein O7610_23995 [Solwaraspora sp. WMMA2065]